MHNTDSDEETAFNVIDFVCHYLLACPTTACEEQLLYLDNNSRKTLSIESHKIRICIDPTNRSLLRFFKRPLFSASPPVFV